MTVDTPTRIINAAMVALVQHGSRKLSMSDICTAAGVSRGTLYRYFRNKDDVLQAIGRQVHNGVRDALTAAIAERPAPQDRVNVIIGVLVQTHRQFPEAQRLVELEPDFSLHFVRESYAEFIEIIISALEPVLGEMSPAITSTLGARQLASLLLRTATSTFFIPTSQTGPVPAWAELLAGVDLTPASNAS